jgi:phosphatidylglycerophosphatase A
MEETTRKKTPLDYFSLAISTFGVGFIPLAPGTWGSIIGVLIYLFFRSNELRVAQTFSDLALSGEFTTAWIKAFNALIFLLFCFLGIWASGRTATIFRAKDPQKVVVDEVIGQLIVFLFVPFEISWKLILAGFILFRLFDIWKPYPINSLENLPGGLGVCADDILAGVYGGICLAALYAIVISY